MASTLLAAVLDRKGYIVGDSNASSGLHWLDNPGMPGEASSWSHAGWSNVRCFGFDVRRAADELTVYLAIALTAGSAAIEPFLVFIWLLSLLVHRAWRDDKRCRARYGELWTAYCERARFKMIPFLY